MAIAKTKKAVGNGKRMRASNEHAVKAAVAPAEAIAMAVAFPMPCVAPHTKA